MKDIQKQLDFTTDVHFDIIVNRNRTLHSIVFCELETEEGIEPFPFDDYDNIVMQVKNSYNSDNVVLALSNITNTLLMHTDGRLEFDVEEQTMNVRAGEYVYDMYLHKTGQRKRAFMSGKFIVKDTVTN